MKFARNVPPDRAKRKSFNELLTHVVCGRVSKKACFQLFARVRKLQRSVSMPRHIDTRADAA
jgi:hypothetical protein